MQLNDVRVYGREAGESLRKIILILKSRESIKNHKNKNASHPNRFVSSVKRLNLRAPRDWEERFLHRQETDCN